MRFDADLQRICKRLDEYYEPREVALWLNAKQKLLDDQRPIDLIRYGNAVEVERVLDQLDDCVYL